MLRPIRKLISENVGSIIHREALVLGEVKKDNNDGSYDVEIFGDSEAYPRIFTLSRNPDLKVGDKVRILYKNGCKELPIILPPVVAQYLYTVEATTDYRPIYYVLVKRSLLDLSVVSSISLSKDEELYGNIAFDKSGYLYGYTGGKYIGTGEYVGKWDKKGNYIGKIQINDYISDRRDLLIEEYSGCTVIGDWVYFASSWNPGFIRVKTSLDDVNRIELASYINYGFDGDGMHLYCTGWDTDNVGTNAKYDSNGNLIWSKKLADPSNEYGYKLGVSPAGFVIIGTGNGKWLRIFDINGNFKKQINRVSECSFAECGSDMDLEGNVYFMYGMTNIKKYDPNGNEVASCTYDTGSYWIESMTIAD